MTMIALEDMAGKMEEDVKRHIAEEYAGKESGFSYGSPTDEEKAELFEKLQAYDILVAYESVGSWGCDSSSWFLLKRKDNGALHTIYGSHCSCYGFEGQGDIEATDVEYLTSDRFHLPLGGYDENSEQNKVAVKDFLASLKANLSETKPHD